MRSLPYIAGELRKRLDSAKTSSIALILLISLVLCSGCIPRIPDDFKTEESLYQHCMLLVKDGNSDEALKFLNSFRTRYPLSPHTPEVELTIGDLHFQRDEYVEAINIYQQFLDLHPTHPRYNYALMQTGKSYMKQVPDTIDRDQSNVRQAIDKFQLLRTDQKFGTEADELTKALKLQLARRDRYVADYYLKRKKWQAAEARLVALVENYAFNDYRDAALYDLVHVNLRLGNRDAAEKRMSELAAAPNADPVVVAKTRALLQSTPPQK